MRQLKQRTPLCYDANGNPLLINLEYMQDLQATINEAASGASASVDLTALEALVATLQVQVATLQGQVKSVMDSMQS